MINGSGSPQSELVCEGSPLDARVGTLRYGKSFCGDDQNYGNNFGLSLCAQIPGVKAASKLSHKPERKEADNTYTWVTAVDGTEGIKQRAEERQRRPHHKTNGI